MRRYTQSQFSQVLQQHPNFRDLDLKGGEMPLICESALVPPVVPAITLPEIVWRGSSYRGIYGSRLR